MATDRLTRQELSWLLAQEARSAATMLRKGVSNLRIETAPTITDVSTTLDALDDAVKTLATLQSGGPAHARRGRIDVAALILELAPHATLNLEPGTGTEILAEESELRRMLQVLLTFGTPPGGGSASIAVRCHDGEIRVEVALGPDSSGAAGIEQAWLHRMAVRHGGRLGLEGNTVTLQLPAGAEQREVEELRRELAAAQEQGEMYAREIASMFATGPAADEAPVSSAHEPSLGALCGSLAATLRPELVALRDGVGDRDARLGALLALVDSLGRFAQSEGRRASTDLARALHDAIANAGAR
ncbi:MAG: sensor histidine kinase, partial [Myxococcales bacterium]